MLSMAAACFGLGRPPQTQEVKIKNLPFTNCVLEVDPNAAGWQKSIKKLLNSIGVSEFTMNGAMGTVQISGTVNPALLLKVLGKAKNVKLKGWNFGDCSSNLNPGYPTYNHYGSYPYPQQYRYQQYGPPNRPYGRLSSTY